jgi:hypothetical protein
LVKLIVLFNWLTWFWNVKSFISNKRIDVHFRIYKNQHLLVRWKDTWEVKFKRGQIYYLLELLVARNIITPMSSYLFKKFILFKLKAAIYCWLNWKILSFSVKYKIYVNNFSFSVQSATFQTIELENSSNRLDLSVLKSHYKN